MAGVSSDAPAVVHLLGDLAGKEFIKKYQKIAEVQPMTDLLKKFSAAAKTVKSNNNPVRVCVYGAYRENLKDINPDDLPENIQIIYESVKDRLTSVRPKGDIGEDEAGYLAQDILHMADVVKIHSKRS